MDMFGDVDFADLKPSILNLIILLLMIAVAVNLGKFVVSKWPIPGLTPLIQNI